MQRAPRTPTQGSAITQQGAYAYHLDAKAFAGYLTRLATSRGVHHLVDDITEVGLTEDGAIAGIQTARGRKLEADLYIDCTGFASLLIERALGDKFIDWSRTLLCDRAVVLPVEHGGKPEMTPYTRATALGAGWLWRIPLAQRTGNGYVYSSRFISEEDAAAELLKQVGKSAGEASPNQLRMRIGRRGNFWLRNCVAVGLSAGFLEPLESTGIYLIQKGIELLLDHFPRRDCSPALAQAYNAKLGHAYEEVRDFILLHYLLSEREEPFWQASRAVLVPPTLAHSLALYDKTGLTEIAPGALFQAPSFYAITAGQGRLPAAWHAMADYADEAMVEKTMDEIKARNFALAQAMPDHGELIKTLHKARKLPA
jgi:tryptophan halogenase